MHQEKKDQKKVKQMTVDAVTQRHPQQCPCHVKLSRVLRSSGWLSFGSGEWCQQQAPARTFRIGLLEGRGPAAAEPGMPTQTATEDEGVVCSPVFSCRF